MTTTLEPVPARSSEAPGPRRSSSASRTPVRRVVGRIVSRLPLGRIVGIALSAVLGWALLNILLSPGIRTAQYGPDVTSRYSIGAVALLIPVLLAASVLSFRLAVPAAPRRSVRLGVGALGVAAAFAVQLVIAWNTARIPASDGYLIIGAAYHAVRPDAQPLVAPSEADAYFSLYSNNIAPAALFATVFRVAAVLGATYPEDFVWAALVVNCAALLLGAVLTCLAVRRLLGARAAAVAAAPVGAFLVVSPWLNVPYTDSLALPVPVGLLLIAVGILDARGGRSRLLRWAGFGLLSGVGCAIKPTCVFAVMALVVAVLGLLLTRAERDERAVLLVQSAPAALAAVAGTVLVSVWSQSSQVVDFSVFSNRNTLPVTHFLAMGAHGTGGYDADDVARSAAMAPDVRGQRDLALFVDRVTQQGAVDYVLFLGRKLLFVLGDGSFYQGLDGYGPVTAFRSGAFADGLQQWYLLGGRQHTGLASVWQAGWLTLLVLCAVPRRRTVGPWWETAVAAALLLLLGYLLLSEARSRYLYIYVPFFILLATSGAARLTGRRRREPVGPPARPGARTSSSVEA